MINNFYLDQHIIYIKDLFMKEIKMENIKEMQMENI